MKINREFPHSELTMLPRDVHLFVAIDAQSNQVFFGVAARVTAELYVMNLQV
jgi:hypothetical protein